MSDQRIPISQLSETQTAPDASYIAIDDGSLTKKITVENFNSTSTASAQSYAEQAAASAQTVEDNIATSAAQIREATLAAREATQASTAATASATSAYDSASLAQNYSVNAATSAGQAMNAADTVAQGVTDSKEYAEDSEAWAVGKRNGTDVPSSDDTYHNNAKYYSDNALSSAIRAENAASSINNPDPTLTIEGVAADSKAVGDRITELKNDFNDLQETLFPGIIKYWDGDKENDTYYGLTISRINNKVTLNGTATSAVRIRLSGIYARTNGKNAADAWSDKVFNDGTKYSITYRLLSGTYTGETSLYIKDATNTIVLNEVLSADGGTILLDWTSGECKVVLNTKTGNVYNDAVFEFTITEIGIQSVFEETVQKVNTGVGAYNDVLSRDVLDGLNLTTPEGNVYYQTLSINKYKNVYSVNGTNPATNLRLPLTGTRLGVSTSDATSARVPDWYVGPITEFILGHDYRINIKIINGSHNASGAYVTFKNGESTSLYSGGDGRVWTCTEIPEAVLFVLKNGDYSNCQFCIFIVDLTAKAEREGDNYYIPVCFNSQLGTAVTKINTDLNDGKTAGTYGTDMESFVFITDVHWAANKQHSPGLIKHILNHTPVQMVVCGGDFIQSHAETKAAAAEEIRGFTTRITEIPCYEYLAIYGNHDSNNNSGADVAIQLTKQETFNLLYTSFARDANVHWIWDDVPAIITDDNPSIKADYYVDHPLTRTRFLCVDWNNPLTTMRQNWITSVLSKNDGYRVIVFYHGIYSGSGGALTPEHTGIMTVIEPYKGKIVALFTGHAHMDAVMDYYGDGSVPVILTSCDTFRSDTMQVGTVDEQCFDVAIIDYTNHVIKLTRIGRGSDREVAFTLG